MQLVCLSTEDWSACRYVPPVRLKVSRHAISVLLGSLVQKVLGSSADVRNVQQVDTPLRLALRRKREGYSARPALRSSCRNRGRQNASVVAQARNLCIVQKCAVSVPLVVINRREVTIAKLVPVVKFHLPGLHRAERVNLEIIP